MVWGFCGVREAWGENESAPGLNYLFLQEELTSTSVEHIIVNPNAAYDKFKDKRVGTKGLGETGLETGLETGWGEACPQAVVTFALGKGSFMELFHGSPDSHLRP